MILQIFMKFFFLDISIIRTHNFSKSKKSMMITLVLILRIFNLDEVYSWSIHIEYSSIQTYWFWSKKFLLNL